MEGGCKYWWIGLGMVLLLPLVSWAQSKPVEAKIVCWNIQMLPNSLALFSKALRKKQRIRAPWIIEHCKEAPYDLIVFQEVFDRDIKRKLKRELKEQYPYQVDTKIAKGCLTSNGILIVSRIPMKYIDHVIYAKGVHEDGWAAKGCTLVKAEKEGQEFYVAGTHLQSGNSSQAVAHRVLQYQDIRKLLDRNYIANRSVFVMGDMNTRKSNVAQYTKMIEIMQVKDFPLNDQEPYTIDAKNSWNNHAQGIQLDYIFLQAHETNTTILNQHILRLKQEHKGKMIDLADHYGIVADIVLSNEGID